MSEEISITSEHDLRAVLASLASAQRMVFFAGLPGVGKSLLIRELAVAAHAAGRVVHLLQWDVARLPFESPAIAARYRERDGVTHPVIRMAVSRWARSAMSRWNQTHDLAHVLIGEVPLVGYRLLDLARVQADDAEPLLAGAGTLFVTPVPSTAVRAVIEGARGETSANPAHPREAGDAPPHLMEMAWRELHAHAVTIGAGTVSEVPTPFNPTEYAAVYRHLLRHRRALMLWMQVQLEPRKSVYDLDVAVNELVPTIDEALSALAQVERQYPVGEIEQEVAKWFDNV